MAKVAFIGLGVMGYPMARHLAQKGGHELTVYNRTPAKAEKWVAEYGGRRADTPRAAAEGAEFVFSCVGNDNDLRVGGARRPGAHRRHAAGRHPSSTTRRPARRSPRSSGRRPAKRGVGFLDAPVSGGQAGAENGTLTVMVGGDAATFEKAKPIIDCYASMVGLMGPTGSGQLTKMVNQICIAGLVQGLSEGIHFAKKAGLDVEQVIGVISKGAAQSWQMENRWKTMNDGKFDFGFAVEWMRKDLSISLDDRPAHRRAAPRRRAGRPVLRRGRRHGRAPLGHVEPDRPAGAQIALRGCRMSVDEILGRAPLARLGEEPGRPGALRHQHGARLRRLDRQSPPPRPPAEARPCAGAGALGDRRRTRRASSPPSSTSRARSRPRRWTHGRRTFDSWDLCDQVCGNLFDRTPFVEEKIRQWAEDEREFVRRAAFALAAEYAVHGKSAPDATLPADPGADRAARDRPAQFRQEGGELGAAPDRQALAGAARPGAELAEKLAASSDRPLDRRDA